MCVYVYMCVCVNDMSNFFFFQSGWYSDWPWPARSLLISENLQRNAKVLKLAMKVSRRY